MTSATIGGEPATVRRFLPADVYDFLELSALAEDGISAGKFGRITTSGERCGCVHGHAGHHWGPDYDATAAETIEISNALNAAGIDYAANDAAVRAINYRKGPTQPINAPVTWDEFVAELGIVRAEPTSTQASEVEAA